MQNNNNLAKHIIISLKQDNVYNKYDPYTKTTRRRPLIQSQNSHFTRSCMNVFSAQSAIQMNNKGFQQHIVNLVFNVDAGAKQSIENY